MKRKIKVTGMKIDHQSVSRHKTFAECAQRYKFRYELGLPSPEPEKPYFIYGTIIHVIAETYVRKRGKIPVGDTQNDTQAFREQGWP